MKKKTVFTAATCLASLMMVLVLAELVVRIFLPQASMLPRLEFSEQYGYVLFRNTTMVHSIPGNGDLHYTINEYGCRGEAVPIASSYDQRNIVVLGDSYAFGQGVSDGQEFPAVLQNCLDRAAYRVSNLSVIGYGLTQEVRRFYEFGQLYRPAVVILQFCANDPSDNLANAVAVVRDGKIFFQNTQSRTGWVKKYMSRSVVQKSHLYNLFRGVIFDQMHNREIVDARIQLVAGAPAANPEGGTVEEQVYDTLLDAFAADLHARGIRFIMIAVNGQLDRFPAIRHEVRELAARQLLEYREVGEWFVWSNAYASPEGHSWGALAHRIIGERLAECILNPPAPGTGTGGAYPAHSLHASWDVRGLPKPAAQADR